MPNSQSKNIQKAEVSEHDDQGTSYIPRQRGKIIQSEDNRQISQKPSTQQRSRRVNPDATQLWGNSEPLSETLDIAITKAISSEDLGALFVFRLKEQRELSELFGRTLGNELTKLVALRMRDCLRQDDYVEQISEDEFAIVPEELELIDDVKLIARRLTEHCGGDYSVTDLPLHIQSTIGIALAALDSKETSKLLRYAHVALQQSKYADNIPYHFFSQELLQKQRQQQQMAADLKQAIDHDRLVLHYQPQYSVKNQRILSVEALVRIQSNDESLISPDKFIPIAEATGLIVPLGQWVIHEACKQFAHWRKKGYTLDRIAINVSPRQMKDSRLQEIIDTAIEEAGIDYCNLELEITEQIMLEQPDVESLLQSFSKKGIRLAVDDFGTGYSSLSYLSNFPMDVLKIDRSFLQQFSTNPKIKAIIKTMISLAQALNLDVIAEGVETSEQESFLREIGCTLGQGFRCSPPRSAQAIEQLL